MGSGHRGVDRAVPVVGFAVQDREHHQGSGSTTGARGAGPRVPYPHGVRGGTGPDGLIVRQEGLIDAEWTVVPVEVTTEPSRNRSNANIRT